MLLPDYFTANDINAVLLFLLLYSIFLLLYFVYDCIINNKQHINQTYHSAVGIGRLAWRQGIPRLTVSNGINTNTQKVIMQNNATWNTI